LGCLNVSYIETCAIGRMMSQEALSEKRH